MRIYAHRGLLAGPDPSQENSLELIETALSEGFDVETDIRRDSHTGSFYIAHELCSSSSEAPAGKAASRHMAVWRAWPQRRVALNLKDLSDIGGLVRLLREFTLGPQVFLFDMELLEESPGETARLVRQLDGQIALAARISERGEPIERALKIKEAEIAWLDEFDGPWATRDVVARLKQAGKEIISVSPELHGRSVAEARQRWQDFAEWGVDGICTDWPRLLDRELNVSSAANS